ncbi:LPS assembly protein LptD [Celerinatantimonas diazotrophica]|uniref:LPS-assembly protein LptD n=1 Tax=Celerinatantimonas diazotrophica TaxID=412034 RepID=A0A4R1KF60_9GAMM|nr:LPS assembly protein LptD [Celerinatantimonas diazotrophica]TCK63262.1 LPS-assembly protein [Celerinatantimonas diazotrophica]CAG9295631.1 LPS-assembly protein LptD [Celerinatantimonas diazotrophica]
MTSPKSLLFCATSIALLSLSAKSYADVNSNQPLPNGRCYVPPAPRLNTPQTQNNKQIAIRSKTAKLVRGKNAEFNDDVAATQGKRRMVSDKASLNQQTQTLTAQGNVKYQDNLIDVDSNKIQTNLKSHATTIDQAKYRFNGQSGRGAADNLKLETNKALLMDNAVYTACPPGDESWSISASSLYIDKNRDWATAHNAVFHVLDVPVFYLPYFSYPISNKRQTGFLYPQFTSSSNNGFDLKTPFYWNMAPNYDLTLTPRLMTKRGQQLTTSFRYLTLGQLGQLDYEYLPNDKITHRNRYLIHWQNNGGIGDHWRLHSDYSRVSDPNYFSDLGSTTIGSTDELLQQGKVDYRDETWNAGLLVNNYQILGSTEDPHKVLPELHFNGLWDTGLGSLKFGLKGQMVNFTDSDPTVYTAQRYHIEPTLKLPLSVPGGYLNSQISLMQTYYNQDTKGDSALKAHISRTLPEYRVKAGLNFDRSMNWFGEKYQQTFEPQVQYLYIPYKNQSDIGIYDTATLEQDYFGMFRDRRYSGLDRISDANQITAGATTRFLNANNEEKLRLSAAQIFYLQSPKVTIPDNDDQYTYSSDRSALAIEGDLNVYHDWFFHSGMQVNDTTWKINKSNTALEWKPGVNKMIQLNYRYGRDDNGTLRNEINQIGTKMVWPLRPNIHLVGSYYRDLYLNRSIESILGVQYDSCCWAFQISFQRALTTHYEYNGATDPRGEIDNAIKFQFILKGIGSGTSNDSDAYRKMMDSGRLPYGHPFYLNN